MSEKSVLFLICFCLYNLNCFSQSFPVSCFRVSRFCTPSEVKFDAFGTSKHGEGKSLSKKKFLYIYQYIGEI